MKNRNGYLDIVRGILILFACSEHFAHFLSLWYIEYFKKSDIIDLKRIHPLVENYLFHLNYIGDYLTPDPIGSTLALMFVPWVTHLFIGFAGYNISRKNPEQLKQGINKINIGLLCMFLLFYAENFIVIREFFGGILISPIIAWMIILFLSNNIYAYFSFRGILLSLIFSIALKMVSNFGYFQISFFSKIISSIHPRMEATEPLNYLPSCLMGVLVGAFLNQKSRTRLFYKKTTIFFGALTIFFLWQSRSLFKHNPNNIFSFDELLISNNFGVLFILSIISVSLIILHQLNNVETPKTLKPLQYVGINSLGIFLIHRVLFIGVLAPIRFHVGSYFKIPMSINTFEIMFVYFPLTVFIYWLLVKFKFFGPLFVRDFKKSNTEQITKT